MLVVKWIWGHFKWLALLLATIKGWALPFTVLLACLLWFIKKLTGNKRILCQRLCSNYTWHINTQERRQSRKLATEKDRGADQEWHKISLKLSLYPLLHCLALAAVLLPLLIFIYLPLPFKAQPALAVLYFLSCTVSVGHFIVWICCQTVSLFTNECSLCHSYSNLCVSDSFL